MFRLHFAAALLGLGLAAATGPGSPTPTVSPARAEIERLVRRYYEEVASERDQTKSRKAVDDLLSGEFVFAFGMRQGSKGIEAHKHFLEWHHEVGPEQVWTIQDLIIESDRAAVRFLLKVKHGSAKFYGVSAPGKRVTTRGVDLFRVWAGRIVELYRVFDGCDYLNQLGATCPPELPQAATPTPSP